MKAISAVILFFFSAILMLAIYDVPSMINKVKELPAEMPEPVNTLPAKQKMTVAEKKKYFIEKTLPAILRVKAEVDEEYARVLQLSQKEGLSAPERSFIETLKKRYNVEGIPCLLKRLRTHPVSIILAQAALETGWGTSRFYNEANNIFGIWSYNANEPRIPASETRGAKTIYVKKYPDLDASIRGYFKMMATGYAYEGFRDARMTEQNPFKLIRHLDHYSELREEYVKRLYQVIRSNRFYQYDSPSFKPLPLAQIIPEYVKRQKALKEMQRLRRQQLENAEAEKVSVPLAQNLEKPDEHCESDPRSTVLECNASMPSSLPVASLPSVEG